MIKKVVISDGAFSNGMHTNMAREYVLFTDHEKDKAEAVLAERKRIARLESIINWLTDGNIKTIEEEYDSEISKIEEEVK